MSSSTFEVRETENEDDKVLEFGLETCEENEISVSASIDEVPKDHTYTKEPDIDEVDIFENECLPDSQPEETNEVTESSENQEQKTMKSKKPKKPASKSKVKKVQSPKKETSKKSKLKKDAVSEESNKNEDNGVEEKSDEKANEEIDEHPRSRKRAQKRKVEEKENVLDTSIVEDIENITEESQLNEENSGQAKKKKITSDSSDESEKEKKVKKEIPAVEDAEDTINLPKGWVRKSVVRKSGKSKGQIDIYIYSPDGIKFRSKPDIAAYIARTKAPVKLEDFDFSRKRGSAITEAQTKSQPKKKKPEPIKSKPVAEKKSSPKKMSPRKPAKLLVKLNVSSRTKNKSGVKSDKQSKNKSSVKKEQHNRNSNVEDGSCNMSDIIIEDIITIELEKESEEVLAVKMNNGKQQPLSFVEISQDYVSPVSIQCSQVNTVSDNKVEKISKSVKRKSFQMAKKQKCDVQEKVNVCTDSIVDDIQKISSPVNENHSQTQTVCVKSHSAVDKEVEELTSTLPDGWCSESRHKSSKSARKGDFYLYSPDGITISSRLELASYLKKNKSSLSVSDFYIKKIIPAEKICETQLSCKKHSNGLNEIFEESKKACVLIEKLPTNLPKKPTVFCKKHSQLSPKARLDLLKKSKAFLMKKSFKGAASKNNDCDNKPCKIEHSNADNKTADFQVNSFESSSVRPRRAVIRKTACELLNLSRRIKTEPKIIGNTEDHKPVLEKGAKESQICDSVTIKEPSKDNPQNCIKEHQIENQASKETQAKSEIIEQSSTPETGRKNVVKPLSSFLKQSKRKKIRANVSEVVICHGNLQEGWKTKIIKRRNGKTAGLVDIYVVSPEGFRFRSKPALAAFLQRTKSAISVESFSFSRKTYCKEIS